MASAYTNGESEDGEFLAVYLIWSAGLSCLSRSPNHTNETDQRNQLNQIPATRREISICKTCPRFPIPS
jgi:hypothetical protein